MRQACQPWIWTRRPSWVTVHRHRSAEGCPAWSHHRYGVDPVPEAARPEPVDHPAAGDAGFVVGLVVEPRPGSGPGIEEPHLPRPGDTSRGIRWFRSSMKLIVVLINPPGRVWELSSGLGGTGRT